MDMPADEPVAEFMWQDLRPVLDEEIAALPAKYRAAFVLCHLQGKTNEQAARELACPLGTILSRLSRARELLRYRLSGRGVTLPSGLLLAFLGDHLAEGAVPSKYVDQTIKAAVDFMAGKSAVVGALSTHAAILAEGVMQTMILTHVRMAGMVLLVAGIVGTAVYSRQGDKKSRDDDLPPAAKSDRVPDTGKDAPRPKGDYGKLPADVSSDYRVPGQTKGDYAKSRDVAPQRRRIKADTTLDKPFTDPDKESLRLANKLLHEDIEDQLALLESLKKKLERLKNSGLPVSPEDPVAAELKRENRRLMLQLRHLQEEVRAAEEDVAPYLELLKRGARNHRQDIFSRDALKK
jgi:hypothetical protein